MKRKKFLIITDAWKPQVSGVITVLEKLISGIKKLGNEVIVINPTMFTTMPLPTYKEIELAVFPNAKIKKIISEEKPDYIHIATEGTLGIAGIMVCKQLGYKYTTAYHTKLPEYVNLRTKIPVKWGDKAMKYFHKKSSRVLVSTYTMKKELEEKGFKNLRVYPLGVDTKKFKHKQKICLNLPKPVFCYMGRVAIEKSIEDFLKLDLPGSKLIIGDGPQREELEKKYPEANFVGYKKGQELVNLLSASDVFVFPSKTDTFGLVILEAMACGLPVAAYNVLGPKDIITNGYDGYTGEDLQKCALECLKIEKNNPLKTANNYSWDNMVKRFIAYQVINKKKKCKKSLIHKLLNLS
ncbi:MAG: glycosyltransferase family 1 protein [Candidatus Gracilibacteria bacterium]|nr:glycosyltransferase family 1 protein [Candidatus Gracilibacteria bacterium]